MNSGFDSGTDSAVVDVRPPATASAASAPSADEARHPFLVALGERVRTLRSRRGMTRKAVALAADVSERHLANLEYGTGNASILVLLQIAGALHCSPPSPTRRRRAGIAWWATFVSMKRRRWRDSSRLFPAGSVP